MKIRIKGNSLRYRLTRSEVERLALDGYIEDTTDFGPTQLTYALQSTLSGNLWACFESSTITLFMPDWMVTEWATTDRVGFENTEDGLFILIEKDFVCLDNTLEDQSDNYPNPLALKC